MPNPSGVPGDDDDDISLSVLDSREMISNEEFSDDEPVKPVISASKTRAAKIEDKKEDPEPPKPAPKKSPSNIPPKVAPPKATQAKVTPVKPQPIPEPEEYSEVPTNKDDVNTEIEDAIQKKNVISLKKEHQPHVKKTLKVWDLYFLSETQLLSADRVKNFNPNRLK